MRVATLQQIYCRIPAPAAKIEQPVRALELGEVTVLDADGKPIAPAK